MIRPSVDHAVVVRLEVGEDRFAAEEDGPGIDEKTAIVTVEETCSRAPSWGSGSATGSGASYPSGEKRVEANRDASSLSAS
jgi:hypothetical protein